MCGSTPANRLLYAVGALRIRAADLVEAERAFRAEGSRLGRCYPTKAGLTYINARSRYSEAREALDRAEAQLD